MEVETAKKLDPNVQYPEVFTTNLPIQLMSDQPEECPHCGRRTVFAELESGHQLHVCEGCDHVYIVEEDED